MHLSSKQKRNSYFQKIYFYSSIKKRWRVGVVLSISIILLFSMFFTCFAWTPTQAERDQLKTTWGATDAEIDQALQAHPNVQNLITLQSYLPEFEAASISGGGTSASLNQFRASAAIRGLGYAVSEMILAAVIGVLAVIAYFCKLLVYYGAQILDLTLQPGLYNFTGNAMISTGWTIVRDVCNMFFLLILLFIAFCTILQIDKYHIKKTLLMLIIMALLINFSKPITIFIFDGSQLLMQMFLSKMSSGTGNQQTSAVIANASQISDFIYKSLPGYWSGAKQTSIDIAVQYLFAVVFLFMLAVAFIVTALFLLIRIVAIMLLIIVSPFAFLAAAVPDFSKMSSSWWNALFKYSFYGPAAAFFLYLAIGLGSALPYVSSIVQTNQGSATLATTITNIIHYATVLVFLYASIIMAQQFGIQFAGAITSRANKILRYGTGLAATQWTGRKAWQGAKYAGRAGARLVDYKVLAPLGISPRANWRAWKQGSEEAEREAMEPAQAKAYDRWNKLLGRKKPKGYQENVQFESEIEKQKKELAAISTQDIALIDVIEKYKNDKSSKARAKTAAALRLLFENNDQNEFMKQYMLTNDEFQKWFKENTAAGKAGKEVDANDPESLREALRFVMERNGADDNTAGRQLFHLGNIALSKGNLANYGMGVYDRTTGGYKISDNATQEANAVAKARNIDVQEKMKRMHWNSLFGEMAEIDAETGQSKTGALHNTGKKLLRSMKAAEIKQLNRSRPDLIERVYRDFKGANQIEAYANDTTNDLSDVERANIKAFVKGVAEQYEAKASNDKRGGKKSAAPSGRQPRTGAVRRGPLSGQYGGRRR